jgi:hypothetical protein
MRPLRQCAALAVLALVVVGTLGCGGGGGSTPQPPPPGVTVTGYVLNAADGSGIAGATVTVGTVSGPTTGGGAFSLSGVPTGSQSWTASATGYRSDGGSITISSDPNPIDPIVLAPTGSQPLPLPPSGL